MSAAVLDRTSIDEQLRWLEAVVELLRQEVGDLRSENAELRRENAELRQQVSELHCDVGYWKSRHADAVKRDVMYLLVCFGPKGQSHSSPGQSDVASAAERRPRLVCYDSSGRE
jgi:FtsZ-binding cell division protein ZapB